MLRIQPKSLWLPKLAKSSPRATALLRRSLRQKARGVARPRVNPGLIAKSLHSCSQFRAASRVPREALINFPHAPANAFSSARRESPSLVASSGRLLSLVPFIKNSIRIRWSACLLWAIAFFIGFLLGIQSESSPVAASSARLLSL